jgi:murein DD-endopeptidase MepM/ murein hydrolase activator NlpD
MASAVTRRLAVISTLVLALAAGGAGVATTAQQPVATASSFGITVIVPGQAGGAAAVAGVPVGSPSGAADSFAYPADGSAVRTGALSASAAARADEQLSANAVSDVLSVALFNGEITFDSAAGRAKAAAGAADTTGAAVTNLVVLGQPVAAAPNLRLALGDWGYLVTLEGGAEQNSNGVRAALTAVHVTLTAEHAGLPAGSEIIIGRADVATSMPAVTTTTVTTPTTTEKKTTTQRPPGPQRTTRAPLPKPPEPPSGVRGIRKPVRPAPTDISAPLSPGGYVFPVYGPSSFSDTYGAPRANVSWHHGEDIFAPLGAPILAVADGTVFSVGWNDVGGYRFWLRDRQGNQFYYAHLSAYSPLAVNGRDVKAGDVIGFLGNTGDAQSTPYHLHFEIHPVALLPMGYDGVVNPFAYLSAWRRLDDVSFAASRGWAPPVPANATAPRPGAFLLGATDISSASGLEPGSLERALVAPVSAEGDGALLRR